MLLNDWISSKPTQSCKSILYKTGSMTFDRLYNTLCYAMLGIFLLDADQCWLKHMRQCIDY